MNGSQQSKRTDQSADDKAPADSLQSGRVPDGQAYRSDGASNANNDTSFSSRIASSASALARDAFASDRQSAASTLSRNLQSGGKLDGQSQASSSSNPAASGTFARSVNHSTTGSNGARQVGESFRSLPMQQQVDMADEMHASPFLDDARNSVYGSYPDSMYEQWASTGKGKARQGSYGQAADWTREFNGSPRLQRGHSTDVDRIYGSGTDGAEVLGMLDDPSFTLEDEVDSQQPEPIADDLFGASTANQAPPAFPQSKETSRLLPSNPEVLADMTGLRSSTDGGDSALATGSWLSAWSDVLEHYTDYVWSPEEKRAIEQAREEMERLKETPQPEAEYSANQTVRRLQQILGHINPKAVARSRAPNASASVTAQPAALQQAESSMSGQAQPHAREDVNGREQRPSAVASRSPSPESWD